MRRFGLAILASGATLALSGCGTPAHQVYSDRAAYGHRYGDFQFCQEVMRHYNFHGGSLLSPSDLEHLKRIQFETSPVSVQSTTAIAMYANQDPRLKKLLLSEVPRMRASKDANVRESAMWIVKWYG